MGAPKGNQFWKLRSKHGRDKLFATSQLLWDAACEYFQWCDENPWQETKISQRIVKDVPLSDTEIKPTQRPYTLTGLCLYLDASSSFWREFKRNLKENEKDFLSVITRIEEIIYTQKFEGAAVGAFNSNIIARDLGLKDKTENETTNINYNAEVTKKEAKEISDALEDEC